MLLFSTIAFSLSFFHIHPFCHLVENEWYVYTVCKYVVVNAYCFFFLSTLCFQPLPLFGAALIICVTFVGYPSTRKAQERRETCAYYTIVYFIHKHKITHVYPIWIKEKNDELKVKLYKNCWSKVKSMQSPLSVACRTKNTFSLCFYIMTPFPKHEKYYIFFLTGFKATGHS